MRLAAGLGLAALALGGCVADYVPRSMYVDYSCDQLREELSVIDYELKRLDGAYGWPVLTQRNNLHGRQNAARLMYFDKRCGAI